MFPNLSTNLPRSLSNVTFSMKTSLSSSPTLFCACRGHCPLLAYGTYHSPHGSTAQCPHIYSHFLKTRDHISFLLTFELTIAPNTTLDIQMFVTLTYIGILVYWTLLEANLLPVDIFKSCSYTEDLLRGFLLYIFAGGKKELIIVLFTEHLVYSEPGFPLHIISRNFHDQPLRQEQMREVRLKERL